MSFATKNFCIIIYGPTAAGKTDFAIKLAESIGNAEIVNFDSGQFYTPLNIGTAKPPDWQTLAIKHHLFDIVNQPINISVARFRELALNSIDDIFVRNKIPILVGGSGFYIMSLLFPPHQLQSHESSPESITEADEQLWNKLYQIDPIRAQQLHQHDTYRIKRALAIFTMTGNLPSTYQPIFNPPCPFKLIYVTRDRQHLYERINQRVIAMLEQGWIQEAQSLMNTPWQAFLKTKKIIGYDELFNFLSDDNVADIKNVSDLIAKRTRNYAKRQETFWAMLKKKLDSIKNSQIPFDYEVVNLTLFDVDLYIKQLLATITHYV